MTPDPPTAPSSTYRLQLRAEFGLDDAATITDYLSDLGVGAVYLSPILRAVRGSGHGYDVADPREIDPERGGAAGFARLTTAAREHDLDVVVDVVPNHAGIADPPQNPAWWDVLARGADSPSARWFDVDWAAGPILLPVLGHTADLESLVTVEPSTRTASGLELRYYDKAFPVAVGTGPAPGETPVDVAARQHYRLVGWRTGDDELNYRRFFTITDLAGLRVEDPAVFAATHALLLDAVRAGTIQGLRIDHPDGLVDPGGYLRRLREQAPAAWITVEKILEPGEDLPPQWPVAGTTGYDALTEISQVLTDPVGSDALTATYVAVSGDDRTFADHVADGKRDVVTTALWAEVKRLGRLAPDVPGAVAAIVELAVAFPVYRSYLPYGAEYLTQAADRAVAVNPSVTTALAALLPRLRDPADELARRFEQLTGPVMAKGVEDSAYYRYARATWLNEVGGDPQTVGGTLDEFHAAQERRRHRFPAAMTTLTTHDTKRSEDVRARLAVLAELPGRWDDVARRLADLAPVPDPALGLLLWQALIGAGFIDRDRMHAYAEKAMREAATGTTWRDPDETFEAAVHAAVDAAYDDAEPHGLIIALIDDITEPGWSNALAQKVIALTMPGVPDVYQGTELWTDSLVDPDNRRPVDYDRRRGLLTAATNGAPPLDETGAAKLWITARALRARRDRAELFTGYAPVRASGPAADHVVGYDRGGAIVVATRLPVGLRDRGGWAGTTIALPAGYVVDAFTGRAFARGTTRVEDVLRDYPVALLLRR